MPIFPGGPSRAMVALEYPDGRVEMVVLGDLIACSMDVVPDIYWGSQGRIAIPPVRQTSISIVGIGHVTHFTHRPEWFPPTSADALPTPTKEIES